MDKGIWTSDTGFRLNVSTTDAFTVARLDIYQYFHYSMREPNTTDHSRYSGLLRLTPAKDWHRSRLQKVLEALDPHFDSFGGSRVRLYNSKVLPFLLHNCGACRLMDYELSSLEAHRLRHFRRILQIHYPSTSNSDVYNRCEARTLPFYLAGSKKEAPWSHSTLLTPDPITREDAPMF
uniref:AlNc14C19G2033 protein n=1 Tax=Albugo laibachii Nc14 TaxID=890382 RepID=F0W562_9STRA|nr:AlNc14C19G2033 [Albugo laibachii Nc14]|eukprot:CCA16253.1 AlNc14C19G2033 [Albugo laibachii Nc14]